MKYSLIFPFLVLLAASPGTGLSGTNPGRVSALRVARPPVIDGRLVESVWKAAIPATGFLQRDPVEGAPASERSEIRVLYDGEALYFGCMFYDSRPEKIVGRLTRRDDEIESDRASIRLDSFHDHQTGYEFTFNAAGVKVDILQYDDGDREDASWDPVWELTTSITDSGWCAEIKIPFGILRYPTLAGDTTEHEWGINFYRWILRLNEVDRWAFTPKSESGDLSRYGHLDGLRGLPPPRRAEILPFLLGRRTWTPATAEQWARDDVALNGGLDLKFGLSNNFVLDATVNPDFGQVEADPAVLNLSTFETFYPEKRPFFIEGTQILRFATFGGDDAGPGLFYSRRIGRALSVDDVDLPEGGAVISIPDIVTIVGAAKVTGKTNGGLSAGVLEAVTSREFAVVADSTGTRSEQQIAPLASYSLVRLKQDVLEGSNIGLLATGVAREFSRPAFTGGFDWNLKLARQQYGFDGFLAGSSTTTSEGDPLQGSAGRFQIARIAAVRWLWSLSGDYTSRGYNINDIGYFRRPNDFGGVAQIVFKDDVPSSLVYSYNVGGRLHERWNFDRANLNRQVEVDLDVMFTNWWEGSLSAMVDAGRYDDRETRGNGLYARPREYRLGAGVQSDARGALGASVEAEYGWTSAGARAFATGMEIEIKPASWVNLELEAGYESVDRFEAWVENLEEMGERLSIFADRWTREVSLTIRGILTFTPDLTLQVYAQQFIGKGHYDGFRQLIQPDQFTPYPYASSPDFNSQTFLSNVVLRWEYLPGSTLYLVWSQSRDVSTGDYFSTFREDLRATYGRSPSNVILLKISYWVPV